ncbi:MAG TPA: ribosome biogenesis GTPase Der [Candidatus Marinimicrobia bacterium]|nr:ribosome biogenesis GTPase Der [Candidatus Neomarinimicrobiota bacterium]
MAKPIVAIIGRPNVGKSTLFNRLVGRRQAIVDKQEGITRDRIYAPVEWTGKEFTLVDTGGYIPDEADIMDSAVRQQVEIALEEADFLLFVVDGRDGISPTDEVLADIIRRSDKDYLLLVNKIDSDKQDLLEHEFHRLGLEKLISVSALSSRKIGDLLDNVVAALGDSALPKAEDPDDIRVAIVGMPNVGKSSITNLLLGEDKSIVTDIPGTTRDSIDSRIKYHGKTIVLVDTAGMRRKAKVRESIEFYSNLRTFRAIDDAHIAIVVVDADKGFDKQDQQIVRQVIDSGRGLILAVNKWDLIQKETNTMDEFKKEIKRLFKSLEDYPMMFTSAKTKQRVSKLMPLCLDVHKRWGQRISTRIINKTLDRAVKQYQPPAVKGKKIRLKYGSQVSQRPPRIAIFSNWPELIPVSYQNYLENQFRTQFDFTGVPLKFSYRLS